ncbi:MAG: hypothetical protein JWN30_832 [Bacilli bacterium]|nr:hypothetical protein [Bacilli bacterium]
MNYSSLGTAIKDLRLEKKLTQTELGQGIVSASMISQIESDHVTPSPTLLARLADRLQVDVEDLRENLQEKMTHLGWYRDAKCLYQAGSYSRALKPYSRLAEQRTQHVDYLEILLDYAECLTNVHQIDDALEQYTHAYHEAIAVCNLQAALLSLSQLARLESTRGNEPLAYLHLRNAHQILLSDDSIPNAKRIPILAQYAKHCYRLFYLTEAEQLLEQAYALTLAEHFEQDKLVNICKGLGIVKKLLKRYDQAAHYFQEAESRLPLSSSESERLQLILHQAGVLTLLEQYTEAYQLLDQCLTRFTILAESRNIANCYHELSIWANKQDKLEQGVEYAQKSLAVLDGESWEAAFVYEILSSLYKKLGQHDQGLKQLERAMRIFISQGYLRSASKLSVALQQWHQELNQYEAAIAIGIEFSQLIDNAKVLFLDS